MCCVRPGAVQPHSTPHVQSSEDHRDLLLQHGPCETGVESHVGGPRSTLQYGQHNAVCTVFVVFRHYSRPVNHCVKVFWGFLSTNVTLNQNSNSCRDL